MEVQSLFCYEIMLVRHLLTHYQVIRIKGTCLKRLVLKNCIQIYEVIYYVNLLAHYASIMCSLFLLLMSGMLIYLSLDLRKNKSSTKRAAEV